MEALADKPKVCGNCGKVDAQLRCPCKVVFYCGKECQQASWESHRGGCSWDLERKLEKNRRRLGRDHIDVGQAAFELGGLLSFQDRHSDAEKWLLEAVRISRLEWEGWFLEAVRTFRIECREEGAMGLFFPMAGLCEVYCKQGKLEEAVKMKKEALHVFRRSGEGVETLNVAAGLTSIGHVQRRQGHYDRAMKTFKKAHEMRRRLLGEDNVDVANSLCMMAQILHLQGKNAESLAMEEEALDIKRRVVGPDDDSIAGSLCALGCFSRDQGRYTEAVAKFEKGLAIERRNHPEKTLREGQLLTCIGSIYYFQGKHEDALGIFKKALRIVHKTAGPHSADAADAQQLMAQVLEGQGKVDEALEMHEVALGILRRAVGTDIERLALHLYHMGTCKCKAKDAGGAVECFREAQGIYTRRGVSNATAASCADFLRMLEGGR